MSNSYANNGFDQTPPTTPQPRVPSWLKVVWTVALTGGLALAVAGAAYIGHRTGAHHVAALCWIFYHAVQCQ